MLVLNGEDAHGEYSQQTTVVDANLRQVCDSAGNCQLALEEKKRNACDGDGLKLVKVTDSWQAVRQ